MRARRRDAFRPEHHLHKAGDRIRRCPLPAGLALPYRLRRDESVSAPRSYQDRPARQVPEAAAARGAVEPVHLLYLRDRRRHVYDGVGERGLFRLYPRRIACRVNAAAEGKAVQNAGRGYTHHLCRHTCDGVCRQRGVEPVCTGLCFPADSRSVLFAVHRLCQQGAWLHRRGGHVYDAACRGAALRHPRHCARRASWKRGGADCAPVQCARLSGRGTVSGYRLLRAGVFPVKCRHFKNRRQPHGFVHRVLDGGFDPCRGAFAARAFTDFKPSAWP